MSQSHLARQSRKSLSAFSRAPSQLSRSTVVDSPTPSGSVSPSGRSSPTRVGSGSTSASTSTSTSKSMGTSMQNAFATPTRDYETPTRRPRVRHSAIGAGGIDSPYTPTRIVYSTHATPPAPLSKSSSIPFDMEASNRAARAYEEKRRRTSLLTAADDAAPQEKKKRFVRTKPLWKRVIEWPGSVVDSAILAVPTSVEEMLPPARFANPIALFLYILQWLLLAPLRAPPADNGGSVINQGGYRSGIDGRWGRYAEPIKAPRRGVVGSTTAFSLTMLLVLLSAANAVWLFTRYRNYDLLLRSPQDPISSPNASPIPAPRRTAKPQTSTADETYEPSPPAASKTEKYLRMAGSFIWMLVQWAARSTLSAFGARQPASSAGFHSGDRVQSLRVWDPPEFCLAFFCAFAPSAPIVSYFLTNSKPFITPILHAATAFLLSHLAASFSQLVKDRQILSAEVMREYDTRFVYKKVFSTMVDRGVGTSDP